MRRTLQLVGVLALLAPLWAAPSLARADVRVTSADGRDWFEVMSDLAESLDSQGTSVALCARQDSGRCAPCGAYVLSFDAIGAAAFEVGACDPATGATYVRLVDRSALFDHTHAVPVPRPIAIYAALARSATTERVTPRAAGSGVACSVSIRPYVRDLEHGVIVPLLPDAYDVRVARMRAQVDPSADGSFVISSTDGAGTELSYDVIERATGAVVLVGHATLSCTSAADVPATLPDAVSPIPTARRDALALAAPAVRRGGGIRVAPHDSDRDAAQTVGIAGLSVATVSVLTLLGIGLGTALHTSPDCVRVGPGVPHTTASGSSGSASPPVCLAWGPPHPSETPAELTWAVVGTLGAGVVLGVAGLIAQALLPPPRATDPRVLASVGPSGGMLGLTLAF